MSKRVNNKRGKQRSTKQSRRAQWQHTLANKAAREAQEIAKA